MIFLIIAAFCAGMIAGIFYAELRKLDMRTYPTPTRLQRAKHILYYTFACLIIIPHATLYGAGLLGEWLDGHVMRFRRWCFSERYSRVLPPRNKRPGE